MPYMRYSIIVLCLVLFIIVDTGCGNSSKAIKRYSRDNCIMSTLISIAVFAPDPQTGQKALDEAFAEFTRIESLTDRYIGKKQPDSRQSDIYQINVNAGVKPVKVSDDTLAMLEQSLHYAQLSAGAFDITVGPLMDLWGFGSNDFRVPTYAEIDSVLALIGYEKIRIDKENNTVFLPVKGMQIDLGGIAKGYATDKAVEKLERLGISSAIINAGGNIYALGSQPDGKPWCIGIQHPRDENSIIAVLRVKDSAVVTSGDYERYYIENGIRYHHILDPATGFPAKDTISSTIVTGSTTDADVLATTTLVLGEVKGMELVTKLDAVDSVLVTGDEKMIITEGISKKIEIKTDSNYVIIPRQ